MSAASASVLPPAPAHRSSTVMPGRAVQAATIIWLPASCTSTRPSCHGALASTFVPSGSDRPCAVPATGTASGQSARRSARDVLSALARTCSGARSSRAGALFRRPGAASSGSTHAGSSEGPRPAHLARAGPGRAAIRRTGRRGPDQAGPARPSPRGRSPAPRRTCGSRDRPARARRGGPWSRHNAAARNSGRSACPPRRHRRGGSDDPVEQLDDGLEASGGSHFRPKTIRSG